ncbi:hypothetical protein, partial [Seonamhaeicola maritimus]
MYNFTFKNRQSFLLRLLAYALFAIVVTFSSNVFAQKVDKLEQWANGRLPTYQNQGWVTGNVTESKAHYTECMTIPYRLEASSLTAGTPYRIKIGYDVKKGGAHAIDYLTSYDYDNNHDLFGHSIEPIDELVGTSLAGSGLSANTFDLPTPDEATPTAGAAVNQPETQFLSIPLANRKITVYGATISAAFYDVGDQNVDGGGDVSTYLTVDFTPSVGQTSVVILWGGHIAAEEVWGEGFSATGITGSPYHMFLEDCMGTNDGTSDDDLDGCGNKEVQLSASAVQDPPTCDVSGPTSTCEGSGNLVFTATTDTGESFNWSFGTNTSGASIVNGQGTDTVTVNPGTAGSFEIKVDISLGTLGGSLTTTCGQTVTVNLLPTVTVSGGAWCE